MGREVTVFQNVNFAGKSQVLTVGRYDVKQLAIGNDALSSLKVPAGMEAILYENAKFGGRKIAFAADTSNVGDFNDKTSSIEVREKPPARLPTGVTLYVDAGFAGKSVTLGVGHHNLAALGVGDDAISSVKVPQGWRVTLFTDAEARGSSVSFAADSANIGQLSDKISSAIVERGEAWAGVALYENDHFGGREQRIAEGRHDAAALQFKGSISSVKVPKGLQVSLYDQTGFAGRKLVLTTHATTLGSFNDKTASVKVEKVSLPEAAGATIFVDVNFAGKSQVLAPGRYEAAQLGIGDEALSSVKVPKGMTVTLYEHSGFRGRSVSFTADTSNVGDFNDKTSSLVVTKGIVATPVPPKPEAPKPVPPKPDTPGPLDPQADLGRLKDLGEVSFDLFSLPFTLPVQFTGTITASAFDKSIAYEGAASISAPFRTSVDPLAITLSKADPISYVFKFATPKGLDDLMLKDVRPNLPGELWTIVDAVVMPFVEVYANSVVVIADDEGSDDDLGDYVDGITLFTTVKGDTFQPFRALQATFPALGLDARTVVLAIASRRGGQLLFKVQAELLLNAALGTQAVVFRSLAVDVDRQTASVAAGLTATFELNIGNEQLELRGGIEGEIGQGGKVTVWGALDAADGAWEDPFGFKGITITGFGVQLSATATFPFVAIGARGGIHIGDGLLGGEIGLLIDPGTPQNSILRIESPEGLDIPRLIGALTNDAIDASKLIAVQIKDLLIHIAPNGGTSAGKTYDPGLELGGKVDLWGWKAELKGKVDYGSGGALKGKLDPIKLSAGGIDFLAITDVAGSGGASVDVEFTASRQGGSIDGKIVLVGGLYSQSIKAEMSTSGFAVDLQSGNMGIYAQAKLKLNSGVFDLRFGPTIGVNVDIAGRSVGLSVGCQVATTISKSAFSQGVGFAFKILYENKSIGPVQVSVPFRTAEDLAQEFTKWFKSQILGPVLDVLKAAGDTAFKWVKEFVTPVAQEAAKFFQDVGAKSEDIAKGLVNTFGTTAEQAVKYLNLGADEAAKILKNTFGKSAEEVGKFLKDVGGYTDSAVNSALSGAGYAANEVADVMGDIFGGSWIPHVDIPLPHVDHVDVPVIGHIDDY
ncbi:beta/gamma crystallin-related protein [Nannocystis pusilla]|uniref:Beta/gamma crystallin-related protein n=1 Tax=Nannocystis pusilla TaxID=889268 RepID=A0A9X3EK75_9BACT|nr:beta/gamma crystallin-related protein [Nannocystis pusilla]MCY1004695.1 beta/gamma crystallin-related protein [Nannocystis pusilla]